MRRHYSRLTSVEEKRNIRRAVVFGILTLFALFVLFTFGFSTVARFAGFLIDLGSSNKPIVKNDTTPPAPPRLDELPEATNQFTVEIKGSTEAGAVVVLRLNSKSEEVVSDNDGKFIFTFKLLDGDNVVSAKARDQAGNESTETSSHKIVYDNDEPKVEVSSPSDGDQFFGASQKQVNIEGNTDSDASLAINDRLVNVNEDGSYSFTVNLSEGENKFTLKATDKAGNTKEQTLTLHFSP